MKKTTLIFTILLLALAFTACGGLGNADETASVNASGTPMPGPGLSDSMHLLLGVISLADSATPLTVDQAAAMLPLWKAVRSLGESDTTAQAEIDALYTQIRGTLSAEQLAIIDGMTFDMQSMAAISEKLGLDLQFGGRMVNADSPEAQATMEALRQSGQMPEFEIRGEASEGMTMEEGQPRFDIQPGGAIPQGGVIIQGEGPVIGGGGGMFGGGAGLTQEQMATAQASGVTPPELSNTISRVWLDALITLLEGILAGE